MAELRTAEVADLLALVELGRRMHQESRYARFDFDPFKYAAVLRAVIPQGLTFVAEQDGGLVGAFVGRVDSHFFGDTKIASDVLAHVVPAHRGLVGVQLIREYKRRAKALGVVEVYLGISAGILMRRVERLYELEGFVRVGGSYVLED
jgi:GNAT superfamily N-acetyltransferase